MKSLLNTLAFCGVVLLSGYGHAQPLHVIWDRSGAGDSSRYGYAILPLGDQNNDGFADWAVFAEGGVGDLPLLEFFHGGNPMPTQPYMTQHFADFNSPGAIRDMGILGDVNGDGYKDWFLVRLGPAPITYEVVQLYYGGPNADTLADVSFRIDGFDEVLPIGDFNGDGYDDLYWYHDRTANYGQVLYGGSPMDTIPDWTVHMIPGSGWQPIPGAHGDLSGNHFADWVSIPSVTNTVYIFTGAMNPDTSPAYTWPSMPDPLAVVNDLNGDGYRELLMRNGDVHFGGLDLHAEPSLRLNFPGGLAHVAACGDFNHDGYGDVVLVTENPWGVLSLYLGHPWVNPEPAFSLYGDYIWTAAGLGDVNGDGIDDLAIGYVDDLDYAGWRGRCVILAGDSTLRAGAGEPRPAIAQRLQVSVYPNPFNSEANIALHVPLNAHRTMLTVLNVLGQQVFQTTLPPFGADYIYHYDAARLATGLYFLRAESGNLSTTQKLMVLR